MPAIQAFDENTFYCPDCCSTCYLLRVWRQLLEPIPKLVVLCSHRVHSQDNSRHFSPSNWCFLTLLLFELCSFELSLNFCLISEHDSRHHSASVGLIAACSVSLDHGCAAPCSGRPPLSSSLQPHVCSTLPQMPWHAHCSETFPLNAP